MSDKGQRGHPPASARPAPVDINCLFLPSLAPDAPQTSVVYYTLQIAVSDSHGADSWPVQDYRLERRHFPAQLPACSSAFATNRESMRCSNHHRYYSFDLKMMPGEKITISILPFIDFYFHLFHTYTCIFLFLLLFCIWCFWLNFCMYCVCDWYRPNI